MSYVCVIRHTLLIAYVLSCSCINCFSNITMYILQSGANSAPSSVYGGLYLFVYARTLQTWKNTEYRYRYRDILKYRYRIPTRLLKIPKKYRKTDTDFKYRHRPMTTLIICLASITVPLTTHLFHKSVLYKSILVGLV